MRTKEGCVELVQYISPKSPQARQRNVIYGWPLSGDASCNMRRSTLPYVPFDFSNKVRRPNLGWLFHFHVALRVSAPMASWIHGRYWQPLADGMDGRDRAFLPSFLLSSIHPSLFLESSAKRWAPGLVKFVAAVVYYFCLALPAAFTQPGACLLSRAL